jgi:hypothetical protein
MASNTMPATVTGSDRFIIFILIGGSSSEEYEAGGELVAFKFLVLSS